MKGLASRWSMLAVAAVLLVGLGGCGGGSDSGTDSTPATTTNVVSTGTIEAFGSIYLNGEKYDTANASVTMDDLPATVAELRVGQYVELKGHSHLYWNYAETSADIIRYHDVLEGPISGIDSAAGAFVAMGQTVLVSLDTVFGDGIEPAALEGLAVGDVVEVSGPVPADGIVHATRIDIKADGGPYDVTGYVTDVALGEHRFDLHDLVVDYSFANLEDFATGAPSVGDLVLVKGFTFLADGAFLATHVELRSEDRLAAGPGDVVEVEGEVTNFVSVTEFTVAGWSVTTTSSTEYEHGTAADLADGAQVQVKGVADAAGVLVAHRIAFREVSTIRIVAQLDALAPDGTLALLGVDVATTDTTSYMDMSVLDLRDFGFDDLTVGNWLDLRGYEQPEGSGEVIATHVVRIDAASGVRMRGPFRDPAPPSFDILTVLVTTSPAADDGTSFCLEALNQEPGKKCVPITAAEFFSQAPGELVEAWGTWTAPVLSAQRVEIKLGED